MKNQLILLLGLMIPAVAAADLPLEAFAQPAQYEEAALSPDGQHLALTFRRKKETVVAIFAIGEKGALRGVNTISAGAAGTTITELAWVNSKRLVMAPGSTTEGLREMLPTGELFAINLDGSAAQRICCIGDLSASLISARTGNPDEILATLRPRGQRLSRGRFMLGRKNMRVAMLNTITGDNRKILDLPEDTVGVTALADRNQVAYLAYFQSSSRHWRLLRSADSGWQAVEGADLDGYPVAADGDAVLLSGRGAGTDTNGVFRVRLGGAGQREVLLADPRWDVASHFLSSDRRSLLAASFVGAEPELRLTPDDHPEKTILARLARSFPGQTVWPHSWSDDGQRLLLTLYSGRNAGDLYLYERKEDKLRFLFASRPTLDPELLQPRRAVSIPLPGGGEMPGFLTAPSAPAPWPMILAVHKTTRGSFDARFDGYSQMLASRGYAVLQINPRGSSGYGAAWKKAVGGYGEPEGDEAALAAADWASAEGLSGPQGVCLQADQWAVYPLARLAARHASRFKCLAARNGVFDPQAVMAAPLWKFSPHNSALASALTGGAPWPDASGLAEFRTPLLAQTGSGALSAPASLMQDFCKVLEKRGLKPQCISIARESEWIQDEETRVKVLQRELDFFAQHLKAPQP